MFNITVVFVPGVRLLTIHSFLPESHQRAGLLHVRLQAGRGRRWRRRGRWRPSGRGRRSGRVVGRRRRRRRHVPQPAGPAATDLGRPRAAARVPGLVTVGRLAPEWSRHRHRLTAPAPAPAQTPRDADVPPPSVHLTVPPPSVHRPLGLTSPSSPAAR